MSIRPFILGLALAAPLFAQANYSINNSAFSCSAALSFANSTGLDAHCTGNFSVTGGTWTSDTKIALSADGDITLDGVTMSAPVINFASLGQLTITSTTVLNVAGTLPGDIVPPPSLSSSPNRPSVPRPDTDAPAGGSGTGGSLEVSAGAPLQLGGGSSGSSGSFSSGGTVVIGGAELHLATPTYPDQLHQFQPPITYLGSNDPANWQTLVIGAAVPEPETYALALAALATLGTGAALARRRKA